MSSILKTVRIWNFLKIWSNENFFQIDDKLKCSSFNPVLVTYLGFDSQFGFTEGLPNAINIHLKLHKIKITHTK